MSYCIVNTKSLNYSSSKTENMIQKITTIKTTVEVRNYSQVTLGSINNNNI